MFSIHFTTEAPEYPYDDKSILAAPGSLLLGEATEDFLSNLSLWGKAEYELHWKKELEALVNGSHKIALVVSYNDPEASSNLEIWRVYRDGDWAHFQNQLFWYSRLPERFDIDEMSRYIQERSVASAEGDSYSEWSVPIRNIQAFLHVC